MNKNKPKLSIGMPVYDGEEYLQSSLDSILGQEFSNFELIIVDNASKDSTEQICKSYALSDSRIKYSRNEKNLGATANYNTVARRAQGEYFKWASSNDICQPGFFGNCVDALERNPEAVLCYPRTRLFDDETGYEEDYDDIGSLLHSDPCERFAAVIDGLRLNNVMNGVARTIAMQNTRLIPDIYCGDQCVIAELALSGKFIETSEFMFFRRMDKASATHLKGAHDVHLHFDPDGDTAMLYQKWKLFYCFFRAIKESGLPRQHKNRLYRLLGTRMRWKRDVLTNDITEAAQWYWRSCNS